MTPIRQTANGNTWQTANGNTCLISRYPCSRTYCCNAKGKELLLWQPFFDPRPILGHIGWNARHTNDFSHHSPNNFRDDTSEEQIIHSFIQFTETTFRIFRPLSSNQIIFSKHRIIFHQPQKILIFAGILPFHINLWLLPESLDDIASYTDLSVNILFLLNFHTISSSLSTNSNP